MENEKTAIILAAGRGSRLKELSLEQPKPMTEVHNRSIISNLITRLSSLNFQHIVVVVGYLADKLQMHITEKFGQQTQFHFVENSIFDKTNNIYSLFLAKDYMTDDFFLFEADVFCDSKIIEELVNHSQNNVIMADTFSDDMNGTVIKTGKNELVQKMYLKKDQNDDFDFRDTLKTMNFYKISGEFSISYFLPKLQAHINGEDVHSYYEQIIKEAIDSGHQFYGLKPASGRWWEIDTIHDLEKAKLIFS